MELNTEQSEIDLWSESTAGPTGRTFQTSTPRVKGYSINPPTVKNVESTTREIRENKFSK